LADESQRGKSKTDSQIAESLNCCLCTIAVARERFSQEGLEAALTERPHPGKPVKLTGKGEAFLTTLACSVSPRGQARWTLRLLADKLVELNIVESISHETVRDRLKKTNLSHGNANSGVLEK
jgi:transposase